MVAKYQDEKTLPLWGEKEPLQTAKEKVKAGKKEIVLENIQTGRQFSVYSSSKLILGRNENQCDLQLTDSDKYMSGTHIMLVIAGSRLYAEDMNSTNGSFVNNCRVDKRTELRVGDILKLGHSEFRLVRFQ